MSSSRKYSRESRSHYSRSSSCSNANRSSSLGRRRPLSSLLVERDLSSPTFDDEIYSFERRSRRLFDDFHRRLNWDTDNEIFDDDFFERRFRNFSSDFGRSIPIQTQNIQNSSAITRNIPVQYTPSTNNYQEEKFHTKVEHYPSTNWSMKQESPTRKRTSLTIFLRQPHVQYVDAPEQRQRTTSSSTYTTRTTTYI